MFGAAFRDGHLSGRVGSGVRRCLQAAPGGSLNALRDFPAESSALDRDARVFLDVPRHRRRYHARSRELYGLSEIIPVSRPGIFRRAIPVQLAVFLPILAGLRDSFASLGDRPGHLRDRLHGRGSAATPGFPFRGGSRWSTSYPALCRASPPSSMSRIWDRRNPTSELAMSWMRSRRWCLGVLPCSEDVARFGARCLALRRFPYYRMACTWLRCHPS